MSDSKALLADARALAAGGRLPATDRALFRGSRGAVTNSVTITCPTLGAHTDIRKPDKAQQKKPAADTVLKSFNTWAFKREHPSNPDVLLKIISDAICNNEPIRFVLYWGKGPRCAIDDNDIACLDFLAALGERIQTIYSAGAAIKLILTNTHATLNGYSLQSIKQYFREVDIAACERRFETELLSQIVKKTNELAAQHFNDGTVSEDVLQQLTNSAAKWYRGDGTAEDGALKYYQMNMLERRAVEIAFPQSIFITFNGSKLRDLFPERLPIFYMYSLRRGVSVKPWFLPEDAKPCCAFCCRCNVEAKPQHLPVLSNAKFSLREPCLCSTTG